MPTTLLLIEADAIDQLAFKRMVLEQQLPYDYIVADSIANARTLLYRHHFDVIVTEHSLPDGNSFELFEVMGTTPTVFVTDAGNEATAVTAMKLGACDYITKDIERNYLKSLPLRVESAIRQHYVKNALQESEARYRDLVENASDLILCLDPDGAILFLNDAWLQALGYTREELRELPFARLVHPLAAESWSNAMASALAGHPALRIETTLLARNGHALTIEGSLNCSSHHGSPAFLRGIFTDITERKQAEKQARLTQIKLEENNRQLRRQHQEIRNFYHQLSHELKTPLTSAREFIALVIDGLGGPINDTQREYLAIAMASCDQLRFCINDLLDATRLETGKLRIELKPASLQSIINRLVKVMSSAATEKGITLLHQLDDDLPLIPIDENRIVQVISNLLGNALKFTPPGGTIRIQAAAGTDQPGFIRISVSDTGRGIPAEQQERIFERLYQVKTDDCQTANGIGLGLYICRELVRMHQGRIWVESLPGTGSTFSFLLPLTLNTTQGRILVVDDNDEIRELIRSLLEHEGYRVATAPDGNSALERMTETLPDVVLIDLQMPGMDGPATLRTIRDNWGAIPVIVHTGHPSGDLMTRAMDSSPFTLLAKPCPMPQLIETVHRLRRSNETLFLTRAAATGH